MKYSGNFSPFSDVNLETGSAHQLQEIIKRDEKRLVDIESNTIKITQGMLGGGGGRRRQERDS